MGQRHPEASRARADTTLLPIPPWLFAQVLTGSPDAALASVSGLSALLNTDPATSSRRRSRRLLQDGEAGPTRDEQLRAAHRADLLNVVSGVVTISLPEASVRNAAHY